MIALENDDVTLLDQAVEDRFIRAVLEYPKLLQITMNSIVFENFSTSVKGKLWNCIIFYYHEFDSLPTHDLLDITIQEVYPGDQSKLVMRLLKRILQMPVPEWGWILKKIDTYVKTIRLQKSLFEASQYLKQGDVKEAEDSLVSAIRDSGILSEGSTSDLELSKGAIYEVARSAEVFCCPTRIYALDSYIRGLFRKELFLIMAPTNVGKSWAALHMATAALFSGKYVLYITLEMSRDRVLQRILQNISGTYSPKSDLDIEKAVQLWDDAWQAKETHQVKSLLAANDVYNNLQILKRFGGKLNVKEHPSGTATIKDLEREIALFDVSFGKLPDVIVIDGLLDIKFSGNTDTSRQRLGLTHIARELRRMASDYNACVVTTHQGNRDSAKADIVGIQHTGESFGIVQVADIGISLNQTKAEHQLGKMRINVMRSRNQQKWGVVEIWQNLDIGQFCQVSKECEYTQEEEEENHESPSRKRVRARQ